MMSKRLMVSGGLSILLDWRNFMFGFGFGQDIWVIAVGPILIHCVPKEGGVV